MSIMNKYNFARPIAVFLYFLTLSCLVTSCHTTEQKQAGDAPKEDSVPPTEVISLQKGKLSSSLQIPGELLPYQEVDIYAKENSFVKKVYVDVGSEVRQGQLLVSMEAPEINSQLTEAQSNLKSIQAIYISAKAHYDRLVETSKTPGTISPNDLDEALAQVNSQNARLQGAKAAYGGIAATQKYLNIKAPFAGVITTRNINPGAYVGPSGKGSDVPLFVLQQQKRLRLVISVPEVYTGLLSHQDNISFNVKSLPNQKFAAKVKRMAGALDERLRSERLEMDVINNDKKLLPGMYAEVTIPLPAKDSAFIVPKTALVSSTEKVFVIRAVNQKAEWVDVKKGREAGGKVEVYGNLNAGDQVIKTATDEIRNGADLQNVKMAE